MSEPSPATSQPYRICFVCLGNICRSPTAEAVMVALLAAEGRDDVHVESAGTGGWHVGEWPDERATAEARRRGVEMVSRAQKFTAGDFDRFDLVVAMDGENAARLRAMAPTTADRAKVRLLREFATKDPGPFDVPDPYYGVDDGFARVFDLVDDACRGLLAHLPERRASR